MSKIYFVDTETTGTKDPEVIQFAWLSVDGGPRDMSTGAAVSTLLRPSKPIELSALATHHIMDEDLVNAQPSKGYAYPFAEGDTIIGHNVDFDWAAMGKPPVRRICMLALSRALWPENDSHSLGAMIYCCYRSSAREMLKRAHDARQDVALSVMLFAAIMEKMPKVQTWDVVHEASERARVPKVMPFGKHKGVAIDKVPADYKAWLLGQPDVDEYLAKALRAKA